MIFSDEKWVKLCELDEDQEIVFTKDYLSLTSELGWGARKFAAHLITHWTNEFQTMLDFLGPDEAEDDKYSGIDGEPMDVREDITDLWEYYSIPYEGLEAEWYRDVLRAKLLSIQLPERLVKSYVEAAKKETMRS